ncbi:MAG: thioredoxin-like domain-containing protein [Pirellulales bacterium]
MLVGVFTTAGCGTKSTAEKADPSGQQQLSARQVLAQMVEAYKDASSYQDAGELYTRQSAAGESQTYDPIPFSVVVERPNKLRMHAFDAMVVSDGDKLRAAVPGALPQQVLQLPAPLELTASNYIRDDYLYTTITRGNELFAPPQIGLLLGGNALETILPGDAEPRLLDPATAGQRECYRVEVPAGGDRWVYWIDRESYALRRIDFPTSELLAEIDPSAGIEKLEVWAEMTGAQLGGKIDSQAFAFEVPEDAHLVKQFVSPVPPPLPQHVGETIEGYSFVDLEGKPVDAASLAGKIVVLDFWFTTCPPCKQSMPLLHDVYERFRSDERVEFLAVSTDQPEVTGEQLQQTLESWGASMPIARDLTRHSTEHFQIPGCPTTVLLGPNGKIHVYKVGYHPQYEDLADAIAMLLDGEDVAALTLAQHEGLEADYQRRLADASVHAVSVDVEIPQAEIQPRSEPKSLTMEKLWQVDSLETPGNVLVVEGENAEPMIHVLDGFRKLATLDAEGNVQSHRELDLPESAVVSFLRTAADGENRRYFLASSAAQQQIHLYDNAWNRTWSFPEGRHQGIWDAAFSDLNVDGQLEVLVGYSGQVGVQGVSMAGERLWKNRSLENVFAVAFMGEASPPEFRAVCVDQRGTLVPLDAAGQHGSDLRVAGRAITSLAAADLDGDGQCELCGIALVGFGESVAVGLDTSGNELWQYALPTGEFTHPVERIVPAQWGEDDRGWLLPGADGSIHLVRADGTPADSFHYGQRIRGLAMTRIGGAAVLLVSSDDGIAAWNIAAAGE